MTAQSGESKQNASSLFEALKQKDPLVGDTTTASSLFEALKQKTGATVGVAGHPGEPKEPDFLQSLVQDMAEPFLKEVETGSRIVETTSAIIKAISAKLDGNEDEFNRLAIEAHRVSTQDPTSYGYLGKVMPLGEQDTVWGNVKESIGTGMEIVSWILPTAPKGAKAQERFLTAFTRGFTSGAGDSLGDGESVLEATLKGTITGTTNVAIDAALYRTTTWAQKEIFKNKDTERMSQLVFEEFERDSKLTEAQKAKVMERATEKLSTGSRWGESVPSGIKDKYNSISKGLGDLDKWIEKSLGKSTLYAVILDKVADIPLAGTYWKYKLAKMSLDFIQKNKILEKTFNQTAIYLPKVINTLSAVEQNRAAKAIISNAISVSVDEVVERFKKEIKTQTE